MDNQAPATATNGQAPAETERLLPEARLPQARTSEWRESRAIRALANALRKQSAGVPTYTVHEAAALLSISPEHLYRLIRADAFPAVRLRSGADQGRYVIPAQALQRLLSEATDLGGTIDASDCVAAIGEAVRIHRPRRA